MSVLNKFFAAITRKKSFGLLMQDYIDRPMLASPSEAAHVYATNPDVYACVREISSSVGDVQLLVADGGDQSTFLPDHPLQKLLDDPNPYSSGTELRETFISYLLTVGSGYILRTGTNLARPPKELYVLPSTAVQPVYGSGWAPEKYNYLNTYGSATYPAEQILNMKLFNLNDQRSGLSPLSAAITSARIGDMARAWNYNLLRRGARPAGALKVKAPLTDIARSRLESKLQEKFEGFQNAGRPMVLEGDMDWQNMGYSPAEMEYQANLRQSTLDICRVYNIPPEMIGDSQNKTYSNYQEARKAFYHETVLPLIGKLADALTHWLAPLYGNAVVITYDPNTIEALQEDRTVVYDRLLRAVAQGVLTINEARAELGLDEVAGGDNPLVAANVLPLDLVSGAPLNDEGL